MNERGERAETIVAEIVGPGTAARLRTLRRQTFTQAHVDPQRLFGVVASFPYGLGRLTLRALFQ
jgi:hypothetical protein